MAILAGGQLLAIGLVLLVCLISAWIFFRGHIGRCTSTVTLTGKTAIVTGANCGIGYQTALDFAKRGARVILACRDERKANKAKDDIIDETGNSNVVVRLVDLCLMESVRSFAEQINREESRLDILVNNAGIASSGKPKEITQEGLETLYAANYFGPFLLTVSLLDLLKKSTPSRIVNVSSVIAKWGVIDFDNLNAEKSFSHGQIYLSSKLALILFTRELAKRLEGKGVTANVLHPGSVNTNILRHMFILLRIPFSIFIKIFCKTPEEGAQTSIYLSVSEDVSDISGMYFADCAIDEGSLCATSRDMDLASKLWSVSEKLTGWRMD